MTRIKILSILISGLFLTAACGPEGEEASEPYLRVELDLEALRLDPTYPESEPLELMQLDAWVGLEEAFDEQTNVVLERLAFSDGDTVVELPDAHFFEPDTLDGSQGARRLRLRNAGTNRDLAQFCGAESLEVTLEVRGEECDCRGEVSQTVELSCLPDRRVGERPQGLAPEGAPCVQEMSGQASATFHYGYGPQGRIEVIDEVDGPTQYLDYHEDTPWPAQVLSLMRPPEGAMVWTAKILYAYDADGYPTEIDYQSTGASLLDPQLEAEHFTFTWDRDARRVERHLDGVLKQTLTWDEEARVFTSTDGQGGEEAVYTFAAGPVDPRVLLYGLLELMVTQAELQEIRLDEDGDGQPDDLLLRFTYDEQGKVLSLTTTTGDVELFTSTFGYDCQG